MMTINDHLRSAHSGLGLLQVLQLPTTALLGVDTNAGAALATAGIRTIFDLGTSALFAQAATAANLAATGFGDVPHDLLKDTVTDPQVGAVAALPLAALRVLSDQNAAALGAALAVETIKEFAFWPPRMVAHDMAGQAAGTRLGDQSEQEDAAADKLRPRFGEYPTERVYFKTLIMLGMAEAAASTPLSDPLLLDAIVDNPVGFGKPAIGALATYAQSWMAEGITLGHMLHSLALAPGEATRVAVVDWSRRSKAATTEAIDESEQLDNASNHARAVSEVQNAVANEMQKGESTTSGWAHSESTADNLSGSIGGGAAGSYGYITGVLGFGGGGSTTSQSADTTFGGQSDSWSLGSRSVMAEMSQRVNDRTEQHASSVRNRRASAVREVSETEHEQISTRIVANYNHMHALTVQDFEVVQVYRVMTELNAFRRVIFVPFALLDFTKPNAADVVSRFRGALLIAALTQRARSLLADQTGSIEVRAGLLVDAPVVSTGGAGGVVNAGMTARLTVSSSPIQPVGGNAGALDAGNATPPTAAPVVVRKVVRPGPIVEILSGDAALIALSFEAVPADRVLIEQDGVPAAAATFTVPANTDRIDFTGDILLRRVTSVSLATSDGIEHIGTMFVRYETAGRQFTFAIPIAAAATTRMQRVSFFSGDSADRQAELLAHLQANRAYYTQAVLRRLDSASLVMLLSGVSWQGRPLTDQIQPAPIAVTGNYLVLGAPAEDDEPSGLGDGTETWGGLLKTRAITFDQRDQRSIPIPTGGVFAEAVLGRSNSAEKLDITRFWNWQDSPIPLQPPEIAPVTAASRAQPESLTPGQLGAPVVNLVAPPAVPDPAGLAAVLGAIANGNMFRDMSGLAGLQAAVQSASAGTLSAATEAGRIASDNYKVATQQATEMGKAAADMWKVLKGSGGSGGEANGGRTTGGPASGGISGDGARINQGRDLDRRGITAASAGERVTDMPSSEFQGGQSSIKPTVSRELDYSDEAAAVSPGLVGATNAALTGGGGGTGGGAGSGSGSGATTALLTTFKIVNRIYEPDGEVRHMRILLRPVGSNIVLDTQNGNTATVDLGSLGDGAFDVEVVPHDQPAAGPDTSVGDPATNPPNRLWTPYTAVINKQGNTFTVANDLEHRVTVANAQITIRLTPKWMPIASGQTRGGQAVSHIVVHHTDDENTSATDDPTFGSLINRSIRAWIGNHFAPHYVIDRDGTVIKLGHEGAQAWHANPSRWDGQSDVNRFSIGIEIVHTNNAWNSQPPHYNEEFTTEQYNALTTLLLDLTSRLGIDASNIVGHSDVGTNSGALPITVVGRKSSDPGIKFDWGVVESAGLGLRRDPDPVDFTTAYNGFFTAHPAGHIQPGVGRGCGHGTAERSHLDWLFPE